MFNKAVKHESKLRLAIAGPSGSGKTYTSLAIATALGERVAVVDTESGSASKYADIFAFDVAEMHAPFHPRKYVEAIAAAAKAGYDVIILDSLSHAWFATGGVLDIVDEAAKRSKSGNTYMAWKEGTPAQNQLIEAIVTAQIHVIGTMRSKTEYALVTDDRGKSAPKKMGMAPIQRDGFEYEFDVMMDMDIDNTGVVTKSRCSALTGAVISKPGRNVADILRDWLSGAPAPTPTPAPAPQPATTGSNGERVAPALQPTKAMFNKLHALGVQKFGPEWDDARHELIGKLTEGRTQSSKQLTYEEVVKLAELVKSFADFVEEVDDNTHYDESDADGAWNSMH